MSAFTEFVQAVEQTTGKQGRRVGKETLLRCPAHDDHEPSLNVAEGDDGTPLIQCRSRGCTFEQVCEAIGHKPGDFLAQEPGEWTPYGTAIAVYSYTDASGKLAYDVCKTADKQFPVRRPDPSSTSGWRWKLGNVQPVLYRLPEVIAAAAAGTTVYVCEGEKDVDAIRRIGGVATCNPGGAGKWRDRYSQALRGGQIVIVADYDEPGIAHAQAVAASLVANVNGSASAVRVVRAAEGKDAADHIAAGFGLDDFIDLEEHERPVFALRLADFLSLEIASPAPILGTSEATIIPVGGLIVLAGMPGVGKTTLALDCAFHLASGQDWLDIPVERPTNILLVENEGPKHKFQEKLRRKAEKFAHELGGEIHIQTWRWGSFSFKDEEVQAVTAAYLDENDIGIVIGDPLDTLGPEGVGSPENTREFVALLVPLGLTHSRTFFFLHHFRKEVSNSEINMVSGAWGGRLDSLMVLRETDRPDELRLSFPKLRHSEEKRPLIIGKLRERAAFEVLAEEKIESADEGVAAAFRGRIIEFLSTRGVVERQVLASMACEVGPRDSSFTRAVRKLVDDRVIAEAKGSDGRAKAYALIPDDPANA